MPTSSQEAKERAVSPEEWVDQYGDDFFRFAVSRLRDRDWAEEAVQDAFLAGIRYQDQYTGQGSQRSWLLSILKRKIIDSMRSRAQLEQQPGTLDSPGDYGAWFDAQGSLKPGILPKLPPDAEVESRELWQVVRHCLGQIPAGQADVFVLSVLEEMKPQRICEELDITLSNLWVRLHRARLGLAACVAAKWFIPEEESREHE